MMISGVLRFAFASLCLPLSAQTAITFSDLPNANFFSSGGQNIGTFYSGLSFGPNVTGLSASRFGGYAAAAFPPNTGDVAIWDSSDPTISVAFSSPIQSFGVWYASLDPVVLQAYDQNGKLIGSTTGSANTDGTTGTPALLSFSGSGIVSVSVTSTPGTFVLSSLSYTLGQSTFFTGQVPLGRGVYYLQFPDANLFGYYNYPASSILYHYDMGFEAFIPGSGTDVYLFDFTSNHWWYTSTTLFPYLYDFSLNTWIYYFPDTKSTGHYSTNPRYFSNLTTSMIFTM